MAAATPAKDGAVPALPVRSPDMKHFDHVRAAQAAVDAVAGVGAPLVNIQQMQRVLETLRGIKNAASINELTALVRDCTQSSRQGAQISRQDFVEWYVHKFHGHDGGHRNRILIRGQLGRSRPASFDIPSSEFTFGKCYPVTTVNAKTTLHEWHAPPVNTHLAPRAAPVVDSERVFGRPTPIRRETIKDVVGNTYGSAEPVPEPTYPSVSELARAHEPHPAPDSRPTRAAVLRAETTSRLIASLVTRADSPDRTPGWTMGRFHGIPRKVESFNARPPHAYVELRKRLAASAAGKRSTE